MSMTSSNAIKRVAVAVLAAGSLAGVSPVPARGLVVAHTQQATRIVNVTAERFSFSPTELSVEMGTEIEFRLKSEDTAHGFRIIGHSIEVVIPKRGRGEATARFAPPAPGTYVFECSRMCGAGHSFMRGTLKVRAASGDER